MMSRGPYIPGCLVSLLLLAGCQGGFQHASMEADPLRGGTPVPSAGAAGTASLPPAAGTGAGGQLPPIPAPGTTVSTAALTSGVDQSLDYDNSLRIATPASRQAAGTALDQNVQLIGPVPVDRPPSPPSNEPGSAGFQGTGEENPVSLVGPVTAGDVPSAGQPSAPVPSNGPSQVSVTGNVAGPVPNNSAPGQPGAQPHEAINDPAVLPASGISPREQLRQQLLARGATWTKEPQKVGEPDEWDFTCSIPDRSDPTGETFRKYRGFGSSGLAAIQNVLAKIDAENPH
jgi:hypothetical protein